MDKVGVTGMGASVLQLITLSEVGFRGIRWLSPPHWPSEAYF